MLAIEFPYRLWEVGVDVTYQVLSTEDLWILEELEVLVLDLLGTQASLRREI